MLGKKNKPYFIAEISSNHNGSFNNAKKLITKSGLYKSLNLTGLLGTLIQRTIHRITIKLDSNGHRNLEAAKNL